MFSPGTAVRLTHTGQTGRVERSVGGGDYIVRLDAGGRVAAPQSHLAAIEERKSAEQPEAATPENPPKAATDTPPATPPAQP